MVGVEDTHELSPDVRQSSVDVLGFRRAGLDPQQQQTGIVGGQLLQGVLDGQALRGVVRQDHLEIPWVVLAEQMGDRVNDRGRLVGQVGGDDGGRRRTRTPTPGGNLDHPHRLEALDPQSGRRESQGCRHQWVGHRGQVETRRTRPSRR